MSELMIHKYCRRLLVCLLSFTLWCSANLDPTKMQQAMQARYGVKGIHALEGWQKLLEENQTNDDLVKLKAVNSFFNKNVRFEEDIVVWKQSDYWATPLETLGLGAGDCEDYTIAKYMSLLQLGMPAERLRLIYVKAQIGGPTSHVSQAHMVLGYYAQPTAIPLILDSLASDIEPANKRTDLRPVFSFNSDGLWVGNQAQPQVDPTARLSRWRDVLARMKQEGF